MCQKQRNRIIVLATSLTFLIVILKYYHQKGPDVSSSLPAESLISSSSSSSPTKYLINNLVCSSPEGQRPHRNESATIQLIILITSHPGDTALRHKLRQILPTHSLLRMGMRRLFLLGRLPLPPPPEGSKYKWVSFSQIQEESQGNGDILMGDFLESYHNLTMKHLMGLEWVVKFCSQAKFLIKQDDDIIVDYFQLDQLLSFSSRQAELSPFSRIIESTRNGSSILGKVLDHQPVIRDPKSKWFVTRQEYTSGDTFPPFVSGWAYITTPKVAGLLVKAAQKIKYFWIDDAHITGTLREEAKVQLIDFGDYFTTFKGQLECCVATPQSFNNQSRVMSPYWCDYVVGPPNDDLDLMQHFHAHASFCHTTKICGRRKGREKLQYRCVITPHMVVNKFTHPTLMLK